MKTYLIVFTIMFSNLGFAENSCQLQQTCCNQVKYVKIPDTKKIKELENEIAKLKEEKELLQRDYDKVVSFVCVQKDESKKYNNSVSLFGAESKTSLNTSQTNTSYSAKTSYETDAGLMYQHDFNRFRGSIGVTIDGTGLLGVGYNF